MRGLKPAFLGLSLVLVAVGLAYAGTGAVGLARGVPDAGVLFGLGVATAAVGVAGAVIARRLRG